MTPASQLKRHHNGLQQHNIYDEQGFSALIVVNTPALDDSGVSHAVEHLVFRRSIAFNHPESLFQLTALTDLSINASTHANTTYYHCHSQCLHTCLLGLNYLLNGLFAPVFVAQDVAYEVYHDKYYGVIYRELTAQQVAQQGIAANRDTSKERCYQYGGDIELISQLTLSDIRGYHAQYYQASQMHLITGNISPSLVASLLEAIHEINKIEAAYCPKAQESKKELEKVIDKERGRDNPHKFSPEIMRLFNYYQILLLESDPHLTLHSSSHSTPSLAKSSSLNSDKQTEHTSEHNAAYPLQKRNMQQQTNNPIALLPVENLLIRQLSQHLSDGKYQASKCKQRPLAKIFMPLFKQAQQQLKQNQATKAETFDPEHSLMLMSIQDKEQDLAIVTSFIINAYPTFLASRIQGHCYAIASQYLEESRQLVFYSAFDVAPSVRARIMIEAIKKLSEEQAFIAATLPFAQAKRINAGLNDSSVDAVAEFIVNNLL
jgi:hypothetical protein